MLYEFRRPDGSIVEKSFPMKDCPKSIVCDDGVEAVRIFSVPRVSMFGANGTASDASKLNADMRARNEAAGRRMRDNWESVKSK